jgi:hypothetical protein
MSTVAGNRDDSQSGRDAGSPRNGPNPRQEEILTAYAQTPNAAAVGRALRTNERHVRRVVKGFPERVDELRRERDQEQRERADARRAKVQDWADASLDETLRQLDSAAAGANASVALSAIKMKLGLALDLPPATAVPTQIDRALEEDERRLAHRISEIEVGVVDEEDEDD